LGKRPGGATSSFIVGSNKPASATDKPSRPGLIMSGRRRIGSGRKSGLFCGFVSNNASLRLRRPSFRPKNEDTVIGSVFQFGYNIRHKKTSDSVNQLSAQNLPFCRALRTAQTGRSCRSKQQPLMAPAYPGKLFFPGPSIISLLLVVIVQPYLYFKYFSPGLFLPVSHWKICSRPTAPIHSAFAVK